tara:strand:+ start:820 stop:1275 length:456 start_codon:yes stop_codon:yes gene_type:complete
MSGYGSIQATLERTNFPIKASGLNEIRLFGNPNGVRSQAGELSTSYKLPPSSQLDRLKGADSRYFNLGQLPGNDPKQLWQVSNTMTPLSNERPRPAMSSTSADRPDAINIAKGELANKEYFLRNQFVLNNRRNTVDLGTPQRPVYKYLGKI